MLRGTLLSLGLGLSLLSGLVSAWLLFYGSRAHGLWLVWLGICALSGRCLWWCHRRREAIASRFYVTPAEHRYDYWRIANAGRLKLIAKEAPEETNSVARNPADRIDFRQ
jgi:hypothetical protein